MLENNKPRHNVRAQGKVRAAAPSADSRSSKSPDANVRMLNYLSMNASESEKYLLEQGANSSVRTSSAAAGMLETWLNSSATLAADADPLDETAFEGYWPKANFDDLCESYQADVDKAPEPVDGSGRAGRERAGLRGGGPETYLKNLRKRLAGGTVGTSGTGLKPERAVVAQSRELGGPVAIRLKPRLEITQNARGERIETYPNGASVIKDALGRVCEIISEKGISVLLSYDEKGHLASFVRADQRGTVHSRAEADKHGVLVRDSLGRVRAQGESMQVDACGCVSITREDGQFWSIDLIRSIHTERRLLPDEHGDWYSMTALFCSDGFRMATRFRKVSVRDDKNGVTILNSANAAAPALAFVPGEDSGSYRFYGRDGSMITFDSDAELHYLKPSQVRGPGSKVVPAEQRGKRQAGTAWEALREYVFNYLAAL